MGGTALIAAVKYVCVGERDGERERECVCGSDCMGGCGCDSVGEGGSVWVGQP